MTRKEAIILLKNGEEGISSWNEWRENNPKAPMPNLKGANLHGANLRGANLNHVILEGADLRFAILKSGRLKGAHLERARLRGVNFSDASLRGAQFDGARIVGANFEGARLRGCSFAGSVLTRANFRKANLVGVDFSNAQLQKVDFRDTTLTNANLEDAMLHGARLDNSDLSNVSLNGAAMIEANVSNSNLAGVTFDRSTRFRGIKVATCFGNAIFVRFAQDQDYIESLIRRVRDDKLRLDHELMDLRRKIDAMPRGPHEDPFPLFFMNCRFFAFRVPAQLRSWMDKTWMRLWALTDYGRSLWRVASFAVVVALIFGAVYKFGDMLDAKGNPDWWFTSFYYSVVTYTTLGFGDVTPCTKLGQVLVTLEVILGYVTLGLLISILANKVARRS